MLDKSSEWSLVRRGLLGLFAVMVMLLVCEGVASLLFIFVEVDADDFRQYYQGDPKLNLLTWTEKYSVHPYFGYADEEIRRFERDVALDNLGDAFILGVTGGSVAAQIARHLRKHSDLLEPLRQLVTQSGYSGIKIVNLAVGGGKQPQQFFIMSYFFEHLDFVINIDGFNDLASYSLLPVYPLEYPSQSPRYFQTSSDGSIYIVLGLSVIRLYKTINQLPRWVPFLDKSYLYFSVWYVVHPLLYQLIRKFEAAYFEKVIVGTWSEELNAPTEQEIIARRAKVWKTHTRRQDELFHSSGRLLMFVQPNQYLPESKPLSEDELSSAVHSDSATRYTTAMIQLRSAVKDLMTEGVKIIDLTQIFSKTHETVYSDNCCHLNKRGKDIIANTVLAAAVRQYGYNMSH